MSILARADLLARTTALLRQNPVVALLGPRQSGKTTLARQILTVRKGQRFDLEDPRDVQRMAEPMTALEGLRGLVVIDEIQRQPNLFPVLRVLADRRPVRARFLVLGSASPELLRQGSETLAGRIRFIELNGFSLNEVGPSHLRRLWRRGGFPRSYLAGSEAESFGWREDFIQTFLERDINQLGVGLRSSVQLRRLWSMLAHRHAQLWNGAELASALGETYPTVKRHLDILTGALMVRQLPPWLPNMEKRLVKAPKVFLRDSGLLHGLLGVRTASELEGHPKLGASWEGFVLEEVIRRTGDRDVYFWATHAGAELDILIQRGRGAIGVEVKWGDAPAMTKSMHIALTDLGLRRLFVVYPGPKPYTLQKNVEVIPAGSLDAILD
jgi:predicted AAA+ superfamily ATPase